MVKWNKSFTKKNKKKSERFKIHDIPYDKFKIKVILDDKTYRGDGFIPNYIEILKCIECVFTDCKHSAYFFPKTILVKELIKELIDLIKQDN